MITRLLSVILLLILLAVGVLSIWPQLFQLHRILPAAQLVSLRGIVILVAVITLAVLLIMALFSSTSRRNTASSMLVLLIIIAANAGVLGLRGFEDEPLPKKESSLRVLAWNTLGDQPPVATTAQLALDQHADVISLSETGQDYAEELAARLGAAGSPMQVFVVDDGSGYLAHSTALLVSTRLGSYRLAPAYGSTELVPSVVAEPVDGLSPRGAPLIVAVHAVAPMPSLMERWRKDLHWLAAICSDRPTILAGDFNATVDHFAGLGVRGDGEAVLGSCRDAALSTGSAALGTWPSWTPPVLGAPIDRVMSTAHFRIDGFRVLTGYEGHGSDHRPVVAQLVQE